MSSNIKRVFGQRPWRAIGAWLLTCYLVGLVVIGGSALFGAIQGTFDPDMRANWLAVSMSPLWSVPAGLVTAGMTALPVWAIVSVLRATAWPRPLCETVIGLVLAVLLLHLASLALSISDPEFDNQSVGLPIWTYVIFGTLGAAAGWTYWRLAGRPGRIENPMADAIKARVFD